MVFKRGEIYFFEIFNYLKCFRVFFVVLCYFGVVFGVVFLNLFGNID